MITLIESSHVCRYQKDFTHSRSQITNHKFTCSHLLRVNTRRGALARSHLLRVTTRRGAFNMASLYNNHLLARAVGWTWCLRCQPPCTACRITTNSINNNMVLLSQSGRAMHYGRTPSMFIRTPSMLNHNDPIHVHPTCLSMHSLASYSCVIFLSCMRFKASLVLVQI